MVFNRGYGQHLVIARDEYIDLDITENPLGKVNGDWLYLRILRLTPRLIELRPDITNPRWFDFLEVVASCYLYISWDAESYF